MLKNKRVAFLVMIEMFWIDEIWHKTLSLIHETRAELCKSFVHPFMKQFYVHFIQKLVLLMFHE